MGTVAEHTLNLLLFLGRVCHRREGDLVLSAAAASVPPQRYSTPI